jgi:ATP-dependent phosphoenolpyruvate carboxykinase
MLRRIWSGDIVLSFRPHDCPSARTDAADSSSDRNPPTTYEHAIRFEKDASIAENGALIAYSGVKTGRSPKDKRVVEHPDSKSDTWWGPVNIPCDDHTFQINRQRALDYLNTQERLYCFDGFAGWDPKYRIKVRVVCSRPYHALFMHTMLIRPMKEELTSFGEPQFVIINAGAFPANKLTTGMGSTTSVELSIEDKQLIILGTGKRISLRNTRAIIDTIHDGSLAKAKTERDPVFGFEVAAECPGVPSEILIPRDAWADKAAYEATAKKLAGLFNKNFETYAAGVSAEVKASAPKA